MNRKTLDSGYEIITDEDILHDDKGSYVLDSKGGKIYNDTSLLEKLPVSKLGSVYYVLSLGCYSKDLPTATIQNIVTNEIIKYSLDMAFLFSISYLRNQAVENETPFPCFCQFTENPYDIVIILTNKPNNMRNVDNGDRTTITKSEEEACSNDFLNRVTLKKYFSKYLNSHDNFYNSFKNQAIYSRLLDQIDKINEYHLNYPTNVDILCDETKTVNDVNDIVANLLLTVEQILQIYHQFSKSLKDTENNDTMTKISIIETDETHFSRTVSSLKHGLNDNFKILTSAKILLNIRAFSSEHLSNITFEKQRKTKNISRYATLKINNISEVFNYYGTDILLNHVNKSYHIHKQYEKYSEHNRTFNEYDLKKLNDFPTQRILIVDPTQDKLDFICGDIYLSEIYSFIKFIFNTITTDKSFE